VLEAPKDLAINLRVSALVDTGFNGDISISPQLAQKLNLQVKYPKHLKVELANNNLASTGLALLNASFMTLDASFTDFPVVALVMKKKNWLDVELGNRLLSSFSEKNNLILCFDYVQKLAYFSD
jgi:predicted aspartyl protease